VAKKKGEKKMKDKIGKGSWAAAFTVGSVWFGTHVGGGFASGNQVIQYFAKYGWTGAIYPLISMALLAYVIYIMMSFAKLNGFTNYKDTFAALYPNPKMEILFEIFYIVIILAAVASAVAGAGEVMANFIGLTYAGTTKILCNLVIIVLLIVLSIFGVKMVMAAATVLSVGILITTACVVGAGLGADMSSVSANYLTANGLEAAAYSSNGLEALWRGVLVYMGFQCVSIPPMIAASTELNLKGIKRASILGWLMNGVALAASGFMLYRWYPVLSALQTAGVSGFTNALGIPNQTVLTVLNAKSLLVVFSLLLFCAFVSTCVTLLYTVVQRFHVYLFPKYIKSEKVRSIIVGVIAILICFSLSMLGLSNLIKYAYGYDGYYGLVVVVLPVLIWGVPKVKKLKAEKAAEKAAEAK
jgi:uncharacterized membrane protein YkvI